MPTIKIEFTTSAELAQEIARAVAHVYQVEPTLVGVRKAIRDGFLRPALREYRSRPGVFDPLDPALGDLADDPPPPP
jgi:hypothetical protein